MARNARVTTNKPKTTRERECARIARERALRHRRQRVMRLVGMVVLGVAVLGGIGTSLWGWQNGFIQNAMEQTQRGVVRLTARSGFVVRNIYLEGRETVSMDAIRQAAALHAGDPLFETSVHDLKTRLESIPAVRVAQIERVLPDTLHIHLVERKPVALWQHNQQLHLIDDKGVVMANAEGTPLPTGLLQVVGEDAPTHAVELLEVVGSTPEIFRQIKAAIRVGERRWNIRFQNGIEVKLPEQNMHAAWKRLVAMQQAQRVLERDVVAIDLRLSDRVYFKLPATSPGASPTSNRRASET